MSIKTIEIDLCYLLQRSNINRDDLRKLLNIVQTLDVIDFDQCDKLEDDERKDWEEKKGKEIKKALEDVKFLTERVV
jgi:hypothetical protein